MYSVLSQGVFLIFIFCIAQQLVCLEALRHEPCCPTGTKKRKDGDDREGGQEGSFHAKQEPSDEPRPYPGVRTEGGEPPPRKGLRLQVFETQSRDESHERKAYRFSDPERQAPSHRPSGEEARAGQPGGKRTSCVRPASEEEAQRGNLSSGSSGDTKYTLPHKPFHPECPRAHSRLPGRSRHLPFSVLKFERKVSSRGDLISGSSLQPDFPRLEDKQAGGLSGPFC